MANGLLGKNKPNQAQTISTGSELLAQYKEFWFKENKKLKTPNGSWLRRFRYIEQEFAILHKGRPKISLNLIDSSRNTLNQVY